MRKLIVSNLVSLDGFFADKDGGLDWFQVDREFLDYAVEMLNEADTLIFGRATYQHMADYWPTDQVGKYQLVIAERMNHLPKIVYSRTLKSPHWENSRLGAASIGEEITALKQNEGKPGKNLVILGSGTIVNQLTRLKLIDEYRLFIHSVLLGEGKPLVGPIGDKLLLELTRVRKFDSGLVMLTYIYNHSH
jgi:dihydrofolate reductase